MSTDFFMDARCFACGTDNDNGLHLDIKKTAQGVSVAFRLPQWCQGYGRTVHGGIVSTILDELAVWAAFHSGHTCVTGELSVRIRHPMRTGTPYHGNGSVVKDRHRLIHAYAEILDEKRLLHAQGYAKLMKIR